MQRVSLAQAGTGQLYHQRDACSSAPCALFLAQRGGYVVRRPYALHGYPIHGEQLRRHIVVQVIPREVVVQQQHAVTGVDILAGFIYGVGIGRGVCPSHYGSIRKPLPDITRE